MTEAGIKEALNKALKEGQKTKVSILRMLISELSNKKIEDRVKELDNTGIIGVIQKLAKQHKESVEKFKQGKRDDLVAKEEEELRILEEYLPKPLSEEEITDIIIAAIDAVGASSPGDMGKVMKQVLDQAAGRADGKTISRIVKEKLA